VCYFIAQAGGWECTTITTAAAAAAATAILLLLLLLLLLLSQVSGRRIAFRTLVACNRKQEVKVI